MSELPAKVPFRGSGAPHTQLTPAVSTVAGRVLAVRNTVTQQAPNGTYRALASGGGPRAHDPHR